MRVKTPIMKRHRQIFLLHISFKVTKFQAFQAGEEALIRRESKHWTNPCLDLSFVTKHWHQREQQGYTSPGKKCTGFPFQNVLNIKSLVCVIHCYKWFWYCLTFWTATWLHTLRLLHYALLLTPACWKSSNTNARLVAFALSLALDPTFGIHSHRILDIAHPCHL